MRAVAAFEAFKGAIVLAVGFGLLALAHRDLQAWGEAFVAHLHLNPANRTPQIFLHLLVEASARVRWLAAGAAAYAVLRFVEAYGLWRDRRWAEWLAAGSGALYLPIELVELWRGVDAWKLATFAANVAIVWLMARRLASRPRDA